MDVLGLRDGFIGDIEMSAFDSSVCWGVCGREYCLGFSRSVENGLKFRSRVSPEGAMIFL